MPGGMYPEEICATIHMRKFPKGEKERRAYEGILSLMPF